MAGTTVIIFGLGQITNLLAKIDIIYSKYESKLCICFFVNFVINIVITTFLVNI